MRARETKLEFSGVVEFETLDLVKVLIAGPRSGHASHVCVLIAGPLLSSHGATLVFTKGADTHRT